MMDDANVKHIRPNSVVDRCVSTNDLAKNLADAGHPHGTWMSTRIQDRGRGRLGRKWECIEGNLFLSIVARGQVVSLWSWIPLATAVGITRTLRKRFSDLDVRIKWPNDLYLNGKKLGGILCEGVARGVDSYIIIGIGINCVDSPDGLDQDTVDLTEACLGSRVTADDIREEIVSNVLHELGCLNQERSAHRVAESYNQWAVFSPGTKVSWGTRAEQTGQVQSLGPSSELNVILSTGEVKSLYAEDVKLKKME